MAARLAGEEGFTLVELLVAMVVGLVVIFAALSVMGGSWRLNAKTTDHIQTTDRGRVAMDKITQLLGGRTCLQSETPAQGALVTATNDQIEFYASVTSETAPRLVVERRRLTYRPTTKDILFEAWTGSAPPPTPPPAKTTTPTVTRTLAQGVAPAGTTPIFRYYVAEGALAQPTLRLTPPISLANANNVLLVKVNFAVLGNKPSIRTELQNDSQTRSPTCPF
jgi:prepilin-type N-terminal cleavage/methylation domain-containing protein